MDTSNREELMALNIDTELYVSVEQRDAFRREVELHNYVRNFEVTLRRKDGVLLTAMESSFATRDASGKIERYQGFLLDMTEKKRAEDEIRRRNRELNALNAMAVIATQSFDLDEILKSTRRQVISLLGAETGRNFADMQRDDLGSERPEYADQHQRYDHYYQDLGDVVAQENHGVFSPVTQQCGKIPAFRHGEMQKHAIHIQGAIIASGQGAIRLRANV